MDIRCSAEILVAEMEHLIVDAIGPFFRPVTRKRINWSKIPFADLPTLGPSRGPVWAQIREDMKVFAARVSALGFNTVTLDDVAHWVPHPLYDPDLRVRCGVLGEEFDKILALLSGFGLRVLVTSDFVSVTPRISGALAGNYAAGVAFYRETLDLFLRRFPSVSGVVLRVGESDGVDVKEELRSQLAARTAHQVNHLLRSILPIFEGSNRILVFRTWTVGANVVGDLIWHRGRLRTAIQGLDSPALLISMKPGDSDFFRYLPFNPQFFRTPHAKIVELQARREYEGAGEYPCYAGWHFEHVRKFLDRCENVVGLSVWCQTGGWHRFRRLTFLEGNPVWVEANLRAAVDVIRRRRTANESLAEFFGMERAADAIRLFQLADSAIRHLLYIPEYARQRLYFRRVRIPPLIHVYWDCILIVEPVREILRRLVPHRNEAIREGEEAFQKFDEMERLAEKLELPVDDIRFMRDSFRMVLLARKYYFLPFSLELAEEIERAKAAYKAAWPPEVRPRYRIKTSFEPSPLRRPTARWALRVLLRKHPRYRTVLDRILTLNLLSWVYRVAAVRHRERIPKFLRNSAMGIDSIFQ